MTRLSNRQYPMLAMFADRRSDFRMSVEDAKLWDQRPFRSMLIQGWVDFDGGGFYLTDKGRAAWKEFGETDISRRNPLGPLTAYFDATAYGLDDGRGSARRNARNEQRGQRVRRGQRAAKTTVAPMKRGRAA